jgi:basic membrane protein A and related proteins
VAFTAVAADGRRDVGVGLVLSSPLGSRTADPVQYATFQGLLRAKRRLHVQAKAVVPNPTGPVDLAPYDFLARRNYDLVISTPFIAGLSHAARRFRQVKFVALDGTRQALAAPVAENVEGSVFHTEQAAYLAGFVAARTADLRSPPHVVSTVGVARGGPPEPQVQAFIAGFRAGARHADPKIKLLNGYSHSFGDPASCAHIADLQIARGSQVVFAVAGGCGIGALEAAKHKGVYGIGVDTDQSDLGRFILTSVVIDWNRAVFNLARRLVHGRLPTGGNVRFDMRHHFVGLGKFSRQVSPELRHYVLNTLAPQIEQGKIVVPARLNSSH